MKERQLENCRATEYPWSQLIKIRSNFTNKSNQNPSVSIILSVLI